MTAPLDYLLANRCCLLCAELVCDNPDPDGRMHELFDCSDCDGTGSLLVPIADHPIDHDHVTITCCLFLYFPDDINAEVLEKILLLKQMVRTVPLTDADRWQMAKAVGGFLNVSKVYKDVTGTVAGHDAILDMVDPEPWNPDWGSPSVMRAWQPSDEEAVTWVYIEHGYAEAERRVKG